MIAQELLPRWWRRLPPPALIAASSVPALSITWRTVAARSEKWRGHRTGGSLWPHDHH
jgi:hypothetical protein